MVWRRGLLGSAYRRASAASAGLRESRERLQDSSFRLRSHFRTRRPREVIDLALAHVETNKTRAAYRRTDLFERRLSIIIINPGLDSRARTALEHMLESGCFRHQVLVK